MEEVQAACEGAVR